MEATPSVEEQPVAAAIQEATEVVEQVSAYGSLITNSLYLIVGRKTTIFPDGSMCFTPDYGFW